MKRLLRNPALWFNLVVAVILVAALIEMQGFRANARFIPAVFAWITLGLIAVDVLRQVLSAALAPRNGAGDAGADPMAPAAAPFGGDALRAIAYVAVFWVLILLFGFNGVPAVLIWAYLAIEARVRWFIALGAAAFGNVAVLWGMSVLGVRNWRGAGPEILPGLVGGEPWPVF